MSANEEPIQQAHPPTHAMQTLVQRDASSMPPHHLGGLLKGGQIEGKQASSGEFMSLGYSGTSSPQHVANNPALARSYMASNNMSIEQLMAMEAPDDEWMAYPDYRELLHRQRVELETLRKRQFEEREWYKERKRLEMLATQAPRAGGPAPQVHWSVHSAAGRLFSFHKRMHI